MTTEITNAEVASTATSNLAINLRFVTDRCVAARVDARELSEWPPHPGRLFMALAAAYFETDGSEAEKSEERKALEWLASLPAPRIYAVEAEERTPVICFVPVNDAVTANKAMLQSAPGMPRSRQPRAFPTVIPQRMETHAESDPDVIFEWRDVPADEHLNAFHRLCGKLIRIGHSSSLVMAWTNTGSPSTSLSLWEPASTAGDLTCRIAVEGELNRLENACRAQSVDLFARLKSEIDEPTSKTRNDAKKRFAEAFGQPYKASLRPPEPTPATLGVWQGYRLAGDPSQAKRPIHENTYFDRDLLILAKLDGPTLNVERTLSLTSALRAALLAKHGNVAIPPWLTGHEANGAPTTAPHAAFLALPFTGFRHADGHVMGLAIALPKVVPVVKRGQWIGPLLVEQESGDLAEPKIKLWAKDLPAWTLQLENRTSPPQVLQTDTWTKPSTTWASVTPVVLDRFPKASRVEERKAWHFEVAEIVKLACARAGLPEPLEVDVDSTAWHLGAPRAWAKTRRRSDVAGANNNLPLGDGFPLMPAKASRPARPQVHVWLRFDRKVAGPVLIGAGRFLGYGLCQPLERRLSADN